MEILELKLSELHPYESNPRKNDAAIPKVMASIEKFGFKNPIVIDKNNVIVCGHTRWGAAQKLKLPVVPCVIADNLTDEQVRAYRLADNKVAEAAKWDKKLLDIEMKGLIEIDMADFGFDINLDIEEPKAEEEPEWRYTREQGFKSMKLDYIDWERTAGYWEMPVIKATKHIPTDLIEFAKIRSSEDFHKGVHFFEFDYQFERIWNNPEKYFERIKKFDCSFTPDFAMYTDMPLPMQIWNNYRGKVIGQMMQKAGIEVIPTVQWCFPNSYEWCFAGIEPGGTVAISSVGVKRSKDATKIWKDGFAEAMRQLRPSHIVLYGGDMGVEYPCPVTFINNRNVNERNSK